MAMKQNRNAKMQKKTLNTPNEAVPSVQSSSERLSLNSIWHSNDKVRLGVSSRNAGGVHCLELRVDDARFRRR